MRRGVPGAGLTPAQAAAADRYVAEREGKRRSGFDILEHVRPEAGFRGTARYGGLHTVDGCALVLLHHAGKVVVLPVDEAGARRARRLKVGQAVTVATGNAIKVKARSMRR